MNWRMIRTLVVKDVTLFFKNRFFAFITVLALVAYAVMYFIMPSSVDETQEIGFYSPMSLPPMIEALEEEGLEIHEMESEEALKEAVTEGDLPVGVVMPAELITQLSSGGTGEITLYFSTDFPEEFQEMYALFFEELAFEAVGQQLNITATEEIMGPDMTGQQIPTRDRLLPLMAVFVLMMETLGLASLISSEIEQGTLQALLSTPLRIEGLFLGKGLTGVGLALTQAVLLVGIVGGLNHKPLLILVALLLGSILVTGVGFMMASVGRDMMSVMGWGILAILILAVPSFGLLIPGTTSGWLKAIPSYYLVDTVHQVMNFNAGWQDVSFNLLILLLYSAALLWLGTIALRRKFR